MKFYIASRLENAEDVKKLAAVLKAYNWEQTYDWRSDGRFNTKENRSLLCRK